MTRRDEGRTFRRRLLSLALVGALGISAATAQAAARGHARPGLRAFTSCRSLVGYARHNARRTGGRTGVPTRAPLITGQALDRPHPPAPLVPSPTASDGAADKTAAAFSPTNVQEAGVDEPDIVKTDGGRVFAVSNGTLRAIDVSGAAPKLMGALKLDGSGGHQLFLRGDRALIMTTSFAGPVPPGGPVVSDVVAPGRSQVTLTEVDVSDPGAMAVRRTLTVDGGLVDARLTGSMARIVIASSPSYIPPVAIAHAGLRRFVPRTVIRSRVSGRTFRRSVVPCASVRHPRSFSGLDLLTVMTIDLDKGLFAVDRDAIMAGAQTVYASPTSLYVASETYDRALEAGRALPSQSTTEIHRFDATAGGRTAYRSSGEVSGFVLNQFSLSEDKGVLRVASTAEPTWFEDGTHTDSQSYVTVLRESGARLAAVGRVGGLGKGERIRAVRFAGDRGYVVTFRQVDPLYTLDLSQPSNPRVVGELKIQGYSAYLHPITEHLLLGVGQDATDTGATLGVQLSLFDVTDAGNPVRRAHVTLADTSSNAEFDPHAFLYWQPANLAVIPLSGFGQDGTPGFEGAVGFRLGDASLAEAGRITHPAPAGAGASAPPIGRSLVIGDRLYTLSYAGLAANRLDTLAPESFVAFGPS